MYTIRFNLLDDNSFYTTIINNIKLHSFISHYIPSFPSNLIIQIMINDDEYRELDQM